MNKIILLFIALLVGSIGFANNLILDNQTSYPTKSKKSKMMIQWATSGKEVDTANHALINGLALDSKSLQKVTAGGSMRLSIPKDAEYFRILVWSQKSDAPDLHTNWVEVVPEKTYRLQPDHLVPSALMLGTGC